MTTKTAEPLSADKIDNSQLDLLIVDDEEDFRDSAYKYFKRRGFRVEQAEDGEEALNVSVNRKSIS